MSKLTFTYLAAVILSLASVGSGLAAPTVSGVSGSLADGQKLIVTGANFGTKPQGPPLLYDNFEGGTNGAFVGTNNATIGDWDTGAGSDAVKYSSGKRHSGNLSALANFDTAHYNISLSKNGSFPTIYMDYWFNATPISNISRNWKPWRLYGNNDKLTLNSLYMCNGNLINYADSSANIDATMWERGYQPDRWYHVQLIYRESSPGVANGTVRYFLDSVKYGFDSSAEKTRGGDYSFNQIRIGHYWDTGAVDACAANPGGKVYMDDVYIDTSWARVELGNAPTYAASTLREILIPQTWSNGQIEVAARAGSFAFGQTAYVFVTDSNGITQIAGYPVTVGASGSVPPNPPTGVIVQ